MNSAMRSSRFRPGLVGLLGLLLGGLFLHGCGGDDTITAPPPPDGGGTPPAEIADLTLIASALQLPSDGSVNTTISAIVRDANNTVVADVPVVFSADSGLLQVISSVTNEFGIAEARLSTQGNPQNRTITVTAQAESLTTTLAIQVVGTTLTLTGPASVVQGDVVTFTAKLTNSAGAGLAGRTVDIASLNGNSLASPSLTTNSQGEATVQVTATVPGDDVLTASALGLTTTASLSVSNDSFVFVQPAPGTEIVLGTDQVVEVEWLVGGVPQAGTVNFATTRGTLSASSAVLDGAGRASVTVSANTAGPATLTAQITGGPSTSRQVEFVATTPAKINLQARTPTVAPGEQSTVEATVRDANDNPVKNQTVIFTLQDTTGGSLSVGQAVTDSFGQAVTVYTAGQTTSASQGVVVTGTVQGTDPALQASAQLTVARQEVDISIGTGNQIEEPNTATYRKEFTIFVTDNQGAGIPNATVQVSGLSKQYIKGTYVPGNNNLWVPSPTAVCPDEDVNRNGQLDAGEDLNNSGSIEAGNVVAVAPATVTTDANGQATFFVSYAQEFGNWVVVTLQARAAVSGTESLEQTDYGLEISVADAALNQSPPGGIVSRYGQSASCFDTD